MTCDAPDEAYDVAIAWLATFSAPRLPKGEFRLPGSPGVVTDGAGLVRWCRSVIAGGPRGLVRDQVTETVEAIRRYCEEKEM